jgi:ribosomal protein L11 methyltransferase
MILEWLEDTIKGRERILDIGAGSGILSMAAVRLGANSALAVDIDAVAVECAREYASLNGLEKEIEFRVASFEDLASEPFDVVVANIDGRTLPSLCPHLGRLMKEKAAACFSGLQVQDLPDISSALESAGFRISAQRQKAEWIALEIDASKSHR